MNLRRRIQEVMLASAGTLALALVPAPAQALTINLIDDGTVAGTAAEQGFAIAAKYWESVITNDATLNFQVGYAALDPGVLGGTRSNLVTYVPISTYYSLLTANAHSAIDAQATSHLSPLNANGSLTVRVSDYLDPVAQTGIDPTSGRIAPANGEEISSTIAISTANAKALVGGSGGLDGIIQFSSNFAFDFNPTDGISSGNYDFIGVAIHEIGHALGFLSGADDFDYSAADGYDGDVDPYWWGYAADLFRYSNETASGDPILDWTPGTNSFFSIDGGVTAFEGAEFSTGTNYGDGWQASHWKSPGNCSNFLGILNPYICSGQVAKVTNIDVALYDTIGWNFADGVSDNANYSFSSAQAFSAFAVPEPSTWALMIAGFGLTGAAMRRRKVAISFA